MKFTIEGEFVELQQLLKALRLVGTGGEAKAVITQGLIKINGEVETRRRKKIRKGDKIEYNGQTIIAE